MSLIDFINKSWSEHQKDPQKVADALKAQLSQTHSSSDISALAHLATHVYAEHLGEFDKGSAFLDELSLNPNNDGTSISALERFKAVFNLSRNSEHSISNFSSSDQCRILALTASTQVGLKNISSALVFFDLAEKLANGLDKSDPALRAMAITGNNLACALEEQTVLADSEKKLMLKAAHAARTYWQVAGTWLEVERAEYRLSQSYFRIRDLISSIKHANQCLTICEENKAEALEFFFAYEALCKIEIEMNQPIRSLEKMTHFYSLLSEGDRAWCEPILKQIQSHVLII